MKAELELMQGEKEESGLDLDQVRNLLEICTGLVNTQKLSHELTHQMEYFPNTFTY